MATVGEQRTTQSGPRTLILETSGRAGHVALACGDELGEVHKLEESRRHARDLAPAVAALCAARGWKPRDLEAAIVSLGPGSYTGLRVGIISAKALAFATGCALLGVESFAAITRQAPSEAGRVEVVADAQQKKLYVQRWRREASGWRADDALSIKPAAEWLASLTPGVWVSGPGLRLVEDLVPATNPNVAPELREPLPATLLQIGMERWRAGAFDDAWQIGPIYLRASNAEENWDRLRPNEQRREPPAS